MEKPAKTALFFLKKKKNHQTADLKTDKIMSETSAEDFFLNGVRRFLLKTRKRQVETACNKLEPKLLTALQTYNTHFPFTKAGATINEELLQLQGLFTFEKEHTQVLLETHSCQK